MIRIVFLLVPAYPGSPRPKAVKWLRVCVLGLVRLGLGSVLGGVSPLDIKLECICVS